MVATYQDAIEHLVDYVGGTPSDAVQRDCRRAIQQAYRDLTNAFRWSCLMTHGRLITAGPQTDGTIAYDDATRTATLAGATWPGWSVGAYLRVGPVSAKVVKRVDDATVELDELVRFTTDIPAGTPYKLYRDSYVLPADFAASDQLLYESNFGGMEYVHPRDWVYDERYTLAEGTPRTYTITGDPLYPGRLVVRLAPLPGESKTLDYLYLRRPRPLRVAAVAAGTVTTVAGSTQLVAAPGPAFAAMMVGAVVRISATTAPPTSEAGKAPAAFEARIASFTSPTVVDLDAPAPETYPGVAYVVSDPIDVDEGAMLNAFWRCCEKHMAIARTMKEKPDAVALYQAALNEARAADSRSFAARRAGEYPWFRQRLADMPISFEDTAN